MHILENGIRINKPHSAKRGEYLFPPDRIHGVETIGDLCSLLGKDGIPLRESLNVIGKMVSDGAATIEWKSRSKKLDRIAAGGESAKRLCRIHPYLWNVLTYELEWKIFPEYNDFLESSSPVHLKKMFQWEVYEKLFDELLRELGPTSKVIDIGGGVGRAAVPIAQTGAEVTVVDASQIALETTWKHLARSNSARYDLAWADVGNLDFIPDGTFDAGLALEVFCYHGKPRKSLEGAVKKIKPGGWFAFSVENKGGAIFADPSLRKKDIVRIVNSKKVVIDEDLYVEYFTGPELTKMARDAGMKDIQIEYCHFIADGVFGKFAKEQHYGNEGMKRRMHISEKFLRERALTRHLGRAILVYGRVE